MVGQAIKALLLKGLVCFGQRNEGLRYGISCKGKKLCTSLDNDNEYVTEYRALAKAARNQFGGQSELDIFAILNNQAKSMLKTGGYDG